ADLETNGRQRELDDRAVLGRQSLRRDEAPSREGQYHPDEQGEGQEELVAQAQRWHPKALVGGRASRMPFRGRRKTIQKTLIVRDVPTKGGAGAPVRIRMGSDEMRIP